MKPRPLYPGKTFLDELEPQLIGYSNSPFSQGYDTYRIWLNAIRHADTRRFLFDATQAERFAPLVEFPENWQESVREPFPNFYMEFSEPVRLSDAWAVNSNDYLRALIYAKARPIKVVTGINSLLVGAPPMVEERNGSHLVLFFYDPVTGTYTDRNFIVDIRKGLTYVSRYMAERTFEWRNSVSAEMTAQLMARDLTFAAAKKALDDMIEQGGVGSLSAGDIQDMENNLIPTDVHDPSTGLGRVPDDRFHCYVAGDFAEGRNVGWWERQAMAGTSFIQWCLSYMMAKGIVVEVRDVSRQQKRALARQNKPWPKPWHIVIVDPKYVRTTGDEPESTGTHHRYRYDVMGHLRVGRHRVGTKKEDGSYETRQILEWVPDHQRGLANEIYIPATRVVTAGRKIPREIARSEP